MYYFIMGGLADLSHSSQQQPPVPTLFLSTNMSVTTTSAATMKDNENCPTTEDYKAFHSMVCSPRTAERCIKSFTGAILFGEVTEYGDGGDDVVGDDNNHDSYATRTTRYHHSQQPRHQQLRRLDYRYTVPFLSVPSYYLLVGFSLTGLCTLFGATQCFQSSQQSKTFTVDLKSKEKDANNCDNKYKSGMTTKSLSDEVSSMTKFKNLRIKPQIFHYIMNDNDDEVSRTESFATTMGPTTALIDITIDRIFEFSFGSTLNVVMVHILCHGKRHLVEVYEIETSTWLGQLGTITMYPLRFFQQLLNTMNPFLIEHSSKYD